LFSLKVEWCPLIEVETFLSSRLLVEIFSNGYLLVVILAKKRHTTATDADVVAGRVTNSDVVGGSSSSFYHLMPAL